MRIEVTCPGLERARMAKGLTREQLAESLGLRQDSVAALEKGLIHPAAPVRRILMAYFDRRFDELFQVETVSPDTA